MPRIKTATVAEHRELQRRALLDAARGIVLTDGPNALKFQDVADGAGLARSSVYEYFKTKNDLIVSLMEEELPGWKRDVERAMSGAAGPEDAVRAFVEAQLRMVASGRHDLPFALAAADLPEAAEARMQVIHAEIFCLLLSPLEELGARDPGVCLELIAGALAAVAPGLSKSSGRSGRIKVAADFILGGISGLAPR